MIDNSDLDYEVIGLEDSACKFGNSTVGFILLNVDMSETISCVDLPSFSL